MMMVIVVVGVWLVVGCDGADKDDSGHGGKGSDDAAADGGDGVMVDSRSNM